MTSNLLGHTIDNYKAAIERLETTEVDLQRGVPDEIEETVLDALISRDTIHKLLKRKVRWAKSEYSSIKNLDKRLKEQSGIIAKVTSENELHESFHPSAEAWWWLFEPTPVENWLDRYDTFWVFLSLVFVGISLVLFFNVTTQILEGEPDVIGNMLVSLQTIIIPIILGIIFTESGRNRFDSFLRKNFGVSFRLRQEARLLASFFLLILLFTINVVVMPVISNYYNRVGFKYSEEGMNNLALESYKRAVKFNPDNLEAHSNLGVIYEKQYDLESARKQYEIAVSGNIIISLNNLGRLYILEEKYSEAANLLTKGLEIFNEDIQEQRLIDRELEYNLYKNLGWVRLKQGRYGEARNELETAINLREDYSAAHCLIAQVLEENFLEEAGDLPLPEDALFAWEKCVANHDGSDPSEDEWVGKGKKRLNQALPIN